MYSAHRIGQTVYGKLPENPNPSERPSPEEEAKIRAQRVRQSAALKAAHARKSPEERKAVAKAIGKAHRARLDAMSPEELEVEHEKRSKISSKCQRKRFANMSESELQKFLTHTYTGSTSKAEKKMVRRLVSLGYEVKPGHKVGSFIVDVYLPELNLAIEMFGDYWQANPERYASGTLHPTTKQKVDNIWKRDRKRIQSIEALGYTVCVVWESTLKKQGFKKTLRAIIAAHENTEPRPLRKKGKA